MPPSTLYFAAALPYKSAAYERAVSSVGRAPPLQGGCHRFKSCTAHQKMHSRGCSVGCTPFLIARRRCAALRRKRGKRPQGERRKGRKTAIGGSPRFFLPAAPPTGRNAGAQHAARLPTGEGSAPVDHCPGHRGDFIEQSAPERPRGLDRAGHAGERHGAKKCV